MPGEKHDGTDRQVRRPPGRPIYQPLERGDAPTHDAQRPGARNDRCTDPFLSDLASIRILREICRWCAVTALTGGTFVDSYPRIRAALTVIAVIAVIALAIYGLLVGYGMRASILSDWLYTFGPFTRREWMTSTTGR